MSKPDTAAPDEVQVVARDPAAVPVCFVVDEEPSIRHFLSLILHGSGIDAQEFADGASMQAALANRRPDLIFFNVSLEASEAISTIVTLNQAGFRGFVQLMSSRGSAVLENIKSIGEQHSLAMLPVLKKPFETAAVQKVINDLKIGITQAVAARIDLGEALRNDWIEFWYQPKINLRRKQLSGAEAFARARHPEFGVLAPNAFMPGASAEDVQKLAQLSIASTIKASHTFSQIGLNLQFAVNIPLDTLVTLPVADILAAQQPPENWPGLIIDVTEEQIVSDLPLATQVTEQLAAHRIRLAIDDFGRGHSSLARLKSLPFAEMKLDRTFVIDCGTDKVNAPICKTVIDLAHNFGAAAVAVGIEKATDMLALVAMGCDFGQGYLLGQPMPEERFISLLRQRAAARAPVAARPAA